MDNTLKNQSRKLSASQRKKISKRFFLFTLISFLVNYTNCIMAADYSKVMTVSLGPAWGYDNNNNQTFYLAPDIEKTYAAKNPTNAMVDLGIFLGLQKTFPSPWVQVQSITGQLGLALVFAGNAKLSGDIWDDANEEFNNYNYNYKLNHTHVALEGKVLIDKGYWLTPWVSASIGVGFNRAYAFNNSPTIFEAVQNSNFSSYTQTALTYTISAGLQKSFDKNWQAGVGYEFADWGKSKLGRASGQTMNDGLTLNHYYVNSILFNLSYIT